MTILFLLIASLNACALDVVSFSKEPFDLPWICKLKSPNDSREGYSCQLNKVGKLTGVDATKWKETKEEFNHSLDSLKRPSAQLLVVEPATIVDRDGVLWLEQITKFKNASPSSNLVLRVFKEGVAYHYTVAGDPASFDQIRNAVKLAISERR